ncbi:hypothetical protein OAK38_00875 [Verrucomicrobia bacterium]|nr:hypothetical protein [Verrucomicrobiota bacterium]
MKSIIFSTLLFSFSTLFAQETVSNADLSRKLDLILTKVNGLEERVSKLENASAEAKKEIQAVQQVAKDAKTATQAITLPQNSDEKKSFIDKLRIQLKSEETKASGAWTREETWTGMRRNLTEFKVRKLLGKPSRMKLSLDPRLDRIFHYEGDLNADGIEEKGEVRFFRDRVISFESPFK